MLLFETLWINSFKTLLGEIFYIHKGKHDKLPYRRNIGTQHYRMEGQRLGIGWGDVDQRHNVSIMQGE